MFLDLHSGFRYLALLAGLAVIGYAIYGMATKRPYDKTMSVLGSIFRSMMDLTAILGVALLFTGRFPAGLSGHIGVMLLATAISHVVPRVMRGRPPSERTYVPWIVATAVALGLVAVGTLAVGRPIVG